MPFNISLPKRGEGFVLRSFVRGDAPSLADIEFHPEVKKFLVLPTKNKSKWISEFDPENYGGWAVEVNGVVAGRGSILRGKHKGDGELAIVIGHAFWGLQLGSKVAAILIQAAFDELKAKALVGVVHPGNRASIALLRAFKFRRRGVVGSENWQDGHLIYRQSQRAYNVQFHRTPDCGAELKG